MHCRNLSELYIQTRKSHLIAGLVGVNPKFPFRMWCRLIQQCEKMLNMMRPTYINPQISANTYLHGIHDFNCIPMALPVTLSIIHKSTDTRASWAPHDVKGWYVGFLPDPIDVLTSGVPIPEESVREKQSVSLPMIISFTDYPHTKRQHVQHNK